MRRYWMALSALVIGCGDSAGPQDTGVQVIQGLRADTAGSPEQTLVLEVIRRGSPAPGRVVRLTTFPSETDARVAFRAGSRDTTAFEAAADQNGRLVVAVRISGARPGEVLIYAAVPSLGTVDTVRSAVLPGNPVALYQPSPASEFFFVQIGASVPLHAETIDRNGNKRPAQLACQPRSDTVVVDAACNVRGVAAGPTVVTARTPQNFIFTPTVNVVPQGAVARSQVSALNINALDGSAEQIIPIGSAEFRTDLEWAADGSRIYFTQGTAPTRRLRSVTLAGALSDVLRDPVPGVEQFAPQVSKDGAWIYFAARLQTTPVASEIWRVRTDGSALQRVGAASPANRLDDRPSPSPDQTRLAYSTGVSGGERTIRVRVPETGADQFVEQGEYPRWSPVRDEIAFLRGPEIRVRRLAENESRVVAILTAPDALDWSPDGRYLVVSDFIVPPGLGQRTGGGTYVVDVETNARVLTPYAPYAPGSTSNPGVARSAAWRP